MRKKFYKKSFIPLAILTGFCVTSYIVPSKKASAVGTISRVTGLLSRGLSRSSTSLTRANSGIGVSNVAGTAGRRLSNSSIGSQNGGFSAGTTQSILKRLEAVETNQMAEKARSSHPVNKAVAGLGILGSTVMVVGTVAGLVQQVGFMNLTTKQQLEEQKVQSDLNNLRDQFNREEVPEAEQEIINYYKNNYGIDITKNQ